MKLYQHPQAPNPRRVRIFLAEKGIMEKVEMVTINLMTGEQHEESFTEKNPYAALPVLELDDGTIIAESVSISRYFEDLLPEKPLLGGDAKEKGIIDMWLRRIEQGVFSAAGTYFHQATDGIGDDRYRNKEWGRHNVKILNHSLDIMEKQLTKQSYIAGENY